ncbi:hypothetical protein WN944_027833 [Citrus x changshan-huyou]|uniref:Uncharacterized protein n=1 Tax=Citrus x changshan-huyou TaxID=2935761 RepID=A0AAP0LI90_9ROSI
MDQTSGRTRILGFALALMIVSSCMAANGRTLNTAVYNEQQLGQVLAESAKNILTSRYPPSDKNGAVTMDQTSGRTRILGFALALMIVSSCMAANGRTLNAAAYNEQQFSRALAESAENILTSGYPPSDKNRHGYNPGGGKK